MIICTLVVLAAIVFFLDSINGETTLRTGDIAFTSFKSTNKDGFSIVTFVNLPPRTKIRFTDSEWNGNRFGLDENEILWVTGDNAIKTGAIVNFNDLNSSTPSVTYGRIYGSMNLSSKSEAVFAYIGHKKMPTKFLTACANDKTGYQTLINTNLENGKTAIMYPKGTSFALYIGPNNHQNADEYRNALNQMSNYSFQE